MIKRTLKDDLGSAGKAACEGMADVIVHLVVGRSVAMTDQQFAVAVVEDTRLTRMATVSGTAIAQLDVTHIAEYRSKTTHNAPPRPIVSQPTLF